MQKTLIKTIQKEDITRQQLIGAITRKRKTLSLWTEKVEELNIELELVRHEYDVRIGYLLLKDNQLDLEIIQLRNLKRLMEEGMTYDEAVKHEEDAFYNEILRKQKEQEEEIEVEKEFLEKRGHVTDAIEEELKALWKKLIRKFHPDLALDPEEKAKREEFMKKINQAYAEGDLESLKSFDSTLSPEDWQHTPLLNLEKMLVEIENMILFWQNTFKDLRASEWYEWRKKIAKAKKKHEDVFADLERKLLDDIVRKLDVLKILRTEVKPQELV